MMKNSRTLGSVLLIALLSVLLLGLNTPVSVAQKKITTPEKFFGFQMGADKKLARWDKIVEYFYKIEKESDRMKVMNMGPSTLGNPFLVLVISSPENLNNLDKYQKINKKLSDPRGIDKNTIDQYIKEGKSVICQSMSLHASEVGGTQMAPELAYDLLSRNDTEALRILDNVIFFMIPSFNPDGQIMITDWYRETVGTEYEGSGLPRLYNEYTGHDNNRDGDYLNITESKYAAKIMYVDWPPQAYIDHHHMGTYGARIYVPPYCEPIRPYADPLIWREMSWYGAHIAYKLEEAGKKGILNSASFPGWGHFGWHWITPFHNIAGMLTESASVNGASPIYIHPEQLSAGGRAFPEYEAQSTFPNPWPGGWWRLRDIVENKKISAWALLDMAAKNRETVLRNAYLKAKRQTERGASGEIKTIVIPATQHDYLTSVKMINILIKSGIEIKKANKDFTVSGMTYKKGSYIITLAQPKMGLIRNLLTETHYADNSWTRGDDGNPLRPYDLATHTMNEFMGVRTDPLGVNLMGDFSVLTKEEELNGKVYSGEKAYVIDGRMNSSFIAVNLLMDKGVKIKRLDKEFNGLSPGDFIVLKGSEKILEEVAAKTGVDFYSLENLPGDGIHNVKRGRLGMFRRYYGGNMDEGWTRMCLEDFSFPYKSLRDEAFQDENMKDKWDVIILPGDSPSRITGKESAGGSRRGSSNYPEKYKSGIGEEGVKNLKKFVEDGGTLVTFSDSYDFVVEELGIKVANSVGNSSELFCPGSTIWAKFDNTNPLAYGMPDEGLVLFRNDPVLRVSPGKHSIDYQTIVRYKDKDILKSGWLIGEKLIAKKSGMIVAKHGKGKVVMFGFRVQNRNQTDGTFKLLFNTIIQ
ncbi:M14 family zinc carboxypeptidase [Bacteroidota bacterium]